MSIFPLLLSAITCTPNVDGTWTCSGDTISDFPNIVETNGNYVCTNCVAISSNECERLRTEVMTNCQAILNASLSIRSTADSLVSALDRLYSELYSFEPCPYNFISNVNNSTISSVLSQNGYNIISTSDRYSQVLSRLSEWQNTSNYGYVSVDPPLSATLNSSGVYIISTYATVCFHNGLVGLWKSSYSMARSLLSEIGSLYQYPQTITDFTSKTQASAGYMLARSWDVTCASCTLGSSSGGGGGSSSGSDTGCLECYLQYLRSIDSTLDNISSYLYKIKNDLAELKTDFNREIQKVLDSLEDLNDTAGRIDDYLSIDQSNRLFRIHVALDSVTNVINRLHRSFALASDSQVDNDIRDVFTSDGFNWTAYNEKTNWFNRVEILLAHIAGVDSNLVSSVEDQATLSNNVGIVDYDTALGVYDNDTSQETANQDAKDVIDSFSDVLDAFNFFGSVHEPQEIWFIEGGAIDIGDSSSSMAVNVKMSDESYFRDFLRCIRWGCVVLWYLLGFGLLYFMFISLYDKIMKLIRFCLSLSASVFGS